MAEITLENFGPNNRERIIGNSMYRICRAEDDSGNWYIFELYNYETSFAMAKAYFSDDLAATINRLNSFKREMEIIMMMCDLPTCKQNG